MGKLRPFEWLILKTLLKRGLTKIKMFFLELDTKKSCEYPNPSYSIQVMLMEKKLKKLFLTFNWVITKFRLFLVWYELIFAGIKSYKYFGDCSLKIL